jgi:geranylgeranyl pyrophosphate synthase
MIRAQLVFAAASAVGGDPWRAVDGAQAIELLHCASLFHDDVIDNAVERRGLPALHCRVGVGGAIVLGDLLMLRAFAVISQSYPLAFARRVVQVLSEQAQECCRGQLLELELTGKAVSENDYFAIAKGKTAATFVAAAAAGAILGQGTATECEALSKYAEHLGVAFQIWDDVLDLRGNPSMLGKPVGNSLLNQRPLLPLIYLQTSGSTAARAEWDKLRLRGAPRHELVAILCRERIDERVEATRQHHVAAAAGALQGWSDTDGLRALLELPWAVMK